jgi:hypothetical protein
MVWEGLPDFSSLETGATFLLAGEGMADLSIIHRPLFKIAGFTLGTVIFSDAAR